MSVLRLNSRRSRKIRKGSMVEKDQAIKEDPKREEKVMVIKSIATTLTLERGPVASEPNADSSTRIRLVEELVEEKEKVGLTINNRS
jgi:hypothetical protein